jgi:hypothetical protein
MPIHKYKNPVTDRAEEVRQRAKEKSNIKNNFTQEYTTPLQIYKNMRISNSLDNIVLNLNPLAE